MYGLYPPCRLTAVSEHTERARKKAAKTEVDMFYTVSRDDPTWRTQGRTNIYGGSHRRWSPFVGESVKTTLNSAITRRMRPTISKPSDIAAVKPAPTRTPPYRLSLSGRHAHSRLLPQPRGRLASSASSRSARGPFWTPSGSKYRGRPPYAGSLTDVSALSSDPRRALSDQGQLP